MSNESAGRRAEGRGEPHRLGPLGFDRAALAYDATRRCGRHFGSAPTVTALLDEFDRHVAEATDRPGPSGELDP